MSTAVMLCTDLTEKDGFKTLLNLVFRGKRILMGEQIST